MALPAVLQSVSPATTGRLSPLSFFTKANIHASLNSWMVSGWKEPVQNLTKTPFMDDMSEEGSVEDALFLLACHRSNLLVLIAPWIGHSLLQREMLCLMG